MDEVLHSAKGQKAINSSVLKEMKEMGGDELEWRSILEESEDEEGATDSSVPNLDEEDQEEGVQEFILEDAAILLVDNSQAKQ